MAGHKHKIRLEASPGVLKHLVEDRQALFPGGHGVVASLRFRNRVDVEQFQLQRIWSGLQFGEHLRSHVQAAQPGVGQDQTHVQAASVLCSRLWSRPSRIQRSKSVAPPTSCPCTKTWGKVGQPLHILMASRSRQRER